MDRRTIGRLELTGKQKSGEQEEWSKANYQQAFQLLKLMRKERQMKRLQSRYREWYGEEIE